MSRFRDTDGFTLTEIVIAVAIILIISAIVMNVFYNSRNSIDIESAMETTRSVFEEARSMALYTIPESDFGVRIASSTLEIFEGSTYSAGTVIKEVDLAQTVVVSVIDLQGGGVDIVYNSVIGTVNSPGTITLENKRSGATSTIQIHASGLTRTIR